MSLDADTVRRVASLARIRLEPAELTRMEAELNGILGWVEQLQAVPTEGVEPMAGGGAVSLRLREDAVTDGGKSDAVLANAPDREGAYFGVPKVVE
jgi:aspartyl-tRNA(Asn)/glutamyl-tRNA(Gln) amidotransferase subunit C